MSISKRRLSEEWRESTIYCRVTKQNRWRRSRKNRECTAMWVSLGEDIPMIHPRLNKVRLDAADDGMIEVKLEECTAAVQNPTWTFLWRLTCASSSPNGLGLRPKPSHFRTSLRQTPPEANLGFVWALVLPICTLVLFPASPNPSLGPELTFLTHFYFSLSFC